MKKAILILMAAVLIFAAAAYATGDLTKTAEGAVKKIDAATKTLVIDSGGKDMTFICLPTVKLETLKVGDKVKVEYTELVGKLTASKVTVEK